MSSRLRKVMLATAISCTSTIAVGQGVPVIDVNQLQQNLLILTEQFADLERQRNKQGRLEEIEQLHEEQLDRKSVV